MVILREPQSSSVEMREPSRRTTISAALHQSNLYGRVADGSHCSVKGTYYSPLGVCQKAPKRLPDHEKQDSLVWWNQDWTLWPECQASSLEETRHRLSPGQYHPTVKHGGGSIMLWVSQDRGKDEWSKIQRDPWWKPAPERSGPQTGVKVHLPTGEWP